MLTSLECSSWHTKDASIGGIKKFPVSITKASQMVQRPTPTKTVPSALLAAGSLPTRSSACDRSTSISTAHHASSASPEKSTSSKWTKILVCTSMTALLRIPASFAVSLFGSVDLSLMTHKFYWTKDGDQTWSNQRLWGGRLWCSSCGCGCCEGQPQGGQSIWHMVEGEDTQEFRGGL